MVWIVDVPGLNIAEIASRTAPEPEWIECPGLLERPQQSPTRSLAAASRSSQPSDDAGA